MTETMADTRWYAIQTYSGHENKVHKLIQRRIEEEFKELVAEVVVGGNVATVPGDGVSAPRMCQPPKRLGDPAPVLHS